MMLGNKSHGDTQVHVPPWSFTVDNPTFSDSLTSVLQLYLPSNTNENADSASLSVDTHTSDNFRIYEFKIRTCTRAKSHDWTDCPFAHPGEKARRRDPRKFPYSGTPCPDFKRSGSCPKRDECEYAHGVFECWLHPSRYRTQPCKDGTYCTRRICFFAHAPDQLRVIVTRSPECLSPVEGMVGSMRRMQLSKVKSMPTRVSVTRPGFLSLPCTPTRPGVGYFDLWSEEERVESGRDLRAKMFEKLSKENPLDPGRN